ncbi:hypothetical protein LCGC14_0773140 [marine sediment metagenome]|uniref:Uncharacterized protein n=1 Tax=marine sediment metagenome TaxID=412755 RepID=A0A0F9SHP9_9ZZZZ
MKSDQNSQQPKYCIRCGRAIEICGVGKIEGYSFHTGKPYYTTAKAHCPSIVCRIRNSLSLDKDEYYRAPSGEICKVNKGGF